MELAGYDSRVFLITFVAMVSSLSGLIAIGYVFREPLGRAFAALSALADGRPLGSGNSRSPSAPGDAPWGEALRVFAERLGLAHRHVPTSFDSASGEVGALMVRIGPETLEPVREDDDAPVVMRVTIFATAMAEQLVMRRSAGAPRDAASPTGVKALDDAITVEGASKALTQALAAEPELEALVLAAVGESGAVVSGRELVVDFPDFPATPEAIHARVAPLIELTAWLAQPGAFRTGPAIGTASAARLRVLDRLETEPGLALVTRYFGELDATCRGTSYPDVLGRRFEWRGERKVGGRGVPARAVLDWTHSLTLAVRRARRAPESQTRAEFRFEFDRDGSGGAAPTDRAKSGHLGEAGHGIALNRLGGSSKDVARALDALPPALRERVALAMRRDEIRFVHFQSVDVSASFWPALHEMRDPDGQITRTLDLLVELVAAVDAVDAGPEAPDTLGAPNAPEPESPRQGRSKKNRRG